MNDEIVIELGEVSEETKGAGGPFIEDDVPETLPG